VFTKNRKPLDSARATSRASLGTPRKRGRPQGRTATGDATRQRLFRAAIILIGERGYEAATLRDVAKRATVSPGLLYRYFPDKRSVVLALYDELSEAFAERAAGMPSGKWRDRFVHALELSLDVLGPHRVTLRALAPVLLGDVEEGVFARKTAFSRERVQAVFQRAVVDASDAPAPALADAIGRLLYLAHLAVILWWLLDRSPAQRATKALIGLLRQVLPSAALALRLRPMKHFAESLDGLFAEALLNDD
jgi:AcrR family transcriptional regulator